MQIVRAIMELINSHGEQRVAVGLGNFYGFSPVSLEGETQTAELPALPAIRQNDFNVNMHTGVETCLVHSSIMSGHSQVSIPYWDGWQCLEVDDRELFAQAEFSDHITVWKFLVCGFKNREDTV